MATHDLEHTDESDNTNVGRQVGRFADDGDDTAGYAFTPKKPEDEVNDANVGRQVGRFADDGDAASV